MKDYCYQIGQNTDYRDIFGRRWWRHKKDSVSDDLFKTEEWFPAIPGERSFKLKNEDYKKAWDSEAIDSFKCCQIDYYYPAGKTSWEDDETLKPIIAKMTVHKGATLKRELVGTQGRPDVVNYSEALIAPPSDFFMPW